jgi:hypothetical protein
MSQVKENETVKGTFVLDKNLKLHLDVAALVTGQEKSKIVNDALKVMLKNMGCDLSKPPMLPKINKV